MVDPIGYRELLALLVNSRGAITDSGTVVEETAVLGVPSLQIRKATERPQVYDCGSSVKFDPARPEDYPAETVIAQARGAATARSWITGSATATRPSAWSPTWSSGVNNGTIRGHRAEDSHIDVSRSYREDGLPDP